MRAGNGVDVDAPSTAISRALRIAAGAALVRERHHGHINMRIMVAEDQTMVRQALVALQELQPDIERSRS